MNPNQFVCVNPQGEIEVWEYDDFRGTWYMDGGEFYQLDLFHGPEFWGRETLGEL